MGRESIEKMIHFFGVLPLSTVDQFKLFIVIDTFYVNDPWITFNDIMKIIILYRFINMSYRGKKVKYTSKASTAMVPAPKPRRYRRRSTRTPANSPTSGSLGRTILSGGGGLLGGLLGGAFGAPTVGRSIGSMIGDGAATILGMGSYQIKENTLLESSPTVPVMHQVGNSIRISHREYIADVISSDVAGEFKNTVYPLNPGMSVTFPWLSAIANAFEQYETLGFAVEFKSGSGDALNSVNTALGNVLMSAKYDASESAYTSKQSMLNSQWAVEGKPSQNLLLPIECAKSENPFSVMYVRDSALAPNRDIKMYDLCNINVATDGCQGQSVNLGSLWVTYDFLLKKPISIQNQGLTIRSANYSTSSETTGITDMAPFGDKLSAVDPYGADGIGLTISSDTITFPEGLEGRYMITYYIGGASYHLITQPTLTATNCDILTNYGAGSVSILTNADPTYPGVKFMIQFAIDIPSVSASATVKFNNNGMYPIGPNFAQLTVSQVNPDIYPL